MWRDFIGFLLHFLGAMLICGILVAGLAWGFASVRGVSEVQRLEREYYIKQIEEAQAWIDLLSRPEKIQENDDVR